MMESLKRTRANSDGAQSRAVSFRWTFLIEHSLSRFGCESGGREVRHSHEWRVQRDAEVTTRSIVGVWSLGVLGRPHGPPAYLFRCRIFEHELETTPGAAGPSRRARRAAPPPAASHEPSSASRASDSVTELGFLAYRSRGTRRPEGASRTRGSVGDDRDVL